MQASSLKIIYQLFHCDMTLHKIGIMSWRVVTSQKLAGVDVTYDMTWLVLHVRNTWKDFRTISTIFFIHGKSNVFWGEAKEFTLSTLVTKSTQKQAKIVAWFSGMLPPLPCPFTNHRNLRSSRHLLQILTRLQFSGHGYKFSLNNLFQIPLKIAKENLIVNSPIEGLSIGR